MLAGLLTAATIVGTTVGPTAPQRYRIEVTAQQEVDLSAMGQGKQNTDLGVVGFITISLSDTTGGRLAHIVVDSMMFPAGMEAPPGLADDPASAKGIFFHAYIVNGKVKGALTPSTPHQLVSMMAGGVEALFPGMHTSAKVGDKWSDTTKVDSEAEGTKTNSVTMIDWTVSAGPAGAMSYDGVSTGTMTREGPSPNGPQTIRAKITGTRTLTGPAEGPMAKGKIKALQDILVLVEGMADPIPVTAITEVTITPLP